MTRSAPEAGKGRTHVYLSYTYTPISSWRRGGSRLSWAASSRFLKVQRTHTHARTHRRTGGSGLKKGEKAKSKKPSFPTQCYEESADEECR